MIWERIFNVIAFLAGVSAALLSMFAGAYLVWSVMPNWLIKTVSGCFIFIAGGTFFVSIMRAVSQALDVEREP